MEPNATCVQHADSSLFTTKITDNPSPSYVIITPHNYSKTITIKRLNSSVSFIHCVLAARVTGSFRVSFMTYRTQPCVAVKPWCLGDNVHFECEVAVTSLLPVVSFMDMSNYLCY